ncbi:tricarballylate dehydrogenase [Rhodococcus sp. 06-621-2]|nr:FAD-dependent tricarballylate dehydrogenase TcuA [Rhodococcus sp. 06-621-2]OZC55489.1 tricarballylate dehydrogenase [Rhodococcus sp. 06-621-2]
MYSAYDVVVVGGGNAALCAALSARENGARVLVLERAPYEERGGNSRFTAGGFRFGYEGVEDILALVPDLSEEQLANTEFGSYSEKDYFDDLARVTDYRADPDLVNILVSRSFATLKWMASHGVKFLPMYGRQAFKFNGKFKFWGGLAIEANGGGPGLVEALTAAAGKQDIEIQYGARATSLITDNDRVIGLRVRQDGRDLEVEAGAVVLASGGFEANAEWRTRYLGPGWDMAKVRGTRFNTGDGIRMALDIGAMPWGNWSGAHACEWDMNAPTFGDLAVGDGFQKHSYPLGILVNSKGERFLDEGADWRTHTYAKYGQVILAQPGRFAWQVFDSKTSSILRDEYRIKQMTKVSSDTLEGLAARMDGVDKAGFLKTVAEYNSAVRGDIEFDPNTLDGKRTEGLNVDKSNWANPIDQGPFEAYAVTCGVTFTFGGLRITNDTQVVDSDGLPIKGLYACGELVGGIFYNNYPGGTGLMNGAVFGRLAGATAAESVNASIESVADSVSVPV